MRNLDEHPESENLEMSEETSYGSVSCDDEFVAILTLAMDRDANVDIFLELLKVLTEYEQKYNMDLEEFHRWLIQGDDSDLLGDFLSWSTTYYRFIALSGLLGAH